MEPYVLDESAQERSRESARGLCVLELPLLTFLNSEAQFRIVVEIGGGSVACAASTAKVSRKNPKF